MKSREKKEAENLREENEWARFRISWADFRNANRGNNDPEVKPKDLITLSFDKDEVEQQPASFKEVKTALGSRFKRGDGNK